MSGFVKQRPYPVPFEVVHDSAEGKNASEGAVDIVAIHGLGADPKTTWLDWKTGFSVNWLKDLLPRHPGIPYARIICFNFDSRWFGPDLPGQTLRGIAMQLLDHLDSQKFDKQRPTIFIAHSLGGVILEKALVLANSDGNPYQHLVRTTGGIIFLGTPFRGSSDASRKLSEIIGIIADFVGSTERGLVKYSVQSEPLSELLTDFTEIASRNWFGTESVFCFYELYKSTFSAKKFGIPYEMKTRVVDEISGTIDGAIAIPANVNHFNFNKFRDDQNETYIAVSDKIAKLSSNAWQVVNTNLKYSGQEISEEKRIKILDWLWHGDFQMRHKSIKEERCKHTGKWFLDSNEYQSWILGVSSPILWCEGMPGAGKTFLTSFVIDDLEERSKQKGAAVAFIYFNYQDQEEQNPTKIIACLIKQLVSRKTSLPKIVTEFYNKLSGEARVPDFSQLVGLLRSLSAEFSTAWIALDALDECNEGTRDKVLSSLVTLDSQPFKLFMTTRPHPQYLKDIRQARDIALKIQITPSPIDLELYMRQKLGNAKQDLQPGFIDMLVSELATGADGMFLFLALQINHILEQTSQRGMKKALDKTPSSLDGLYDLMMRKIYDGVEGHRILAKRTIAWIFLSKRPLKKDELVEALAVEEGDRNLDGDNMTDIDFIMDVCAGFVTKDPNNGIVRFVHKTTQDYLSAKGIIPESAHAYITKTCITYLSFDCFDQIPHESRWYPVFCLMGKHKFLDYAIRNCHRHMKDTGEGDPQLVHKLQQFLLAGDKWIDYIGFDDGRILLSNELILRPPLYFAVISGLSETVSWLLDKEDTHLKEEIARTGEILLYAISTGSDAIFKLVLDHWQYSKWFSWLFDPGLNHIEQMKLPVLHITASLGREAMAKMLLDRGVCTESRDVYGRTPLHRAVQHNQEIMVELLLNRGAGIEASHCVWTPLHQGAYHGNQEVVEMLLDRGADINSRDKTGWTPLHRAIRSSHEAVVRLLLDRGADIEARGFNLRTPLYESISHNSQSIFKLLMDRGADIEARDDSQWSPLQHAARNGNEIMVRLLLDRGTEIYPGGPDLQRSLHLVISRDPVPPYHEQVIVKMLLDRGANIEARSKTYQTPLHQAIWNNDETIIKLLLDRGADIESRDQTHQTPLGLALRNGHKMVAKLLLDRGADVKTRDISLSTPLHWAAFYGHEVLVQLLLDRGAGIEARDCDRWTPLHQAASRGYQATAKLLLDQGASIGARDSNLRTPLYLAASHGFEKVVELLLDRGADVEGKYFQLSTPLHEAASHGYDATAEQLLDWGADTEARDSDERTPLHWAVLNGHETMAELLLYRGADIEAKDGKQWTPLHQAVQNGHETVVKLLLDQGGDIQAITSGGETVLQLATHTDLPEPNPPGDRIKSKREAIVSLLSLKLPPGIPVP